jgi:putative nucleotidyltransferase with HDIG domain
MRMVYALRQGPVLVRLLLAALAALLMWLITAAWAPPFSYRSGYVPPRAIIARAEFKRVDHEATRQLQDRARREAEHVYIHDPQPIEELRLGLKNQLFALLRAESFDKADQAVWKDLVAAGLETQMSGDMQKIFDDLRAALAADKDLAAIDTALSRALEPYSKTGLLDKLQDRTEGSQAFIKVKPKGAMKWAHRIETKNVLIGSVRPALEQRLRQEISQAMQLPTESRALIAQLLYNWLGKHLPVTLTRDQDATNQEIEQAVQAVQPKLVTFKAGESRIVDGGKPLTEPDIELLRAEYHEWRKNLTWAHTIMHSGAAFGMYIALYVLCGFYIFHRRRDLLTNLGRYATLLGVLVATVTLCWFMASDQWRAEIVPLLLFGMMVAIAYEKELALLLAASVSLIVAFSLEQGLDEFVILVSSVAAAILFLGRVRTRTKLIYVGAFTGGVVMLTTMGVGTLAGQTFGATDLALLGARTAEIAAPQNAFLTALLAGAAWFGLCSLLAGVLMTGLLPFIERLFDVQTDISLLELGDVAHPLLQELVRRAPGTYNHSINVASIAESAAEAIGANGLLVRVGAYFHDIGKMLKPQYFVENQGSDGNRHESLLPAMSTLVIIAHVKDGADLARQHRLPQSIIDFIEQHHGTTLVEYFYRRAAKLHENDPDGGEIDESHFRYPGPKPQTKETAVLMMSDVVESASRALSDPTPARIESLVHDLAMKRLLDGQFDECGLTLQELHTIEESLVKSLTAVYHGRVRYPEHQTV